MDMDTGRVRLTGCLMCRSAQDVETVQRHLPEHIRLTKAEAGCVSFEVSQSDNPLVWNVDECFADRQAFEFHQQRTRASTWWTATAEIPRQFEVSGLS
ncbi:MAG: antibiotic biosynthesis monooxygenase [Roseinatronobacter sp.]|nr:MAG: antibiotic biosynthesis monooxygenase [Roseinatronobacter sp.]